MMNLAVLILAAAVTGPPVEAGLDPYDRRDGFIDVDHALVTLIGDVQTPAEADGKLVSVAVREGDVVQQGQQLAQIDDRQPKLALYAAQRELLAAREQASDDIEIRFAEASLKVAEADLEQKLQLNRDLPGQVPANEIRRLRLAKERAELQIERSELETKVAKMNAEIRQAEVDSAQDQIARRKIEAALPGVVVQVFRQPGEWVSAGEPVLRIVRMDALYVDGFVDASKIDPNSLAGRGVWVQFALDNGRQEKLAGRVIFISPLEQAGRRVRIRAQVANRLENGQWLLRPGKTALMQIDIR